LQRLDLEAPFLLIAGMAFMAMLDEHGTHLALEKLLAGVPGLGRIDGRRIGRESWRRREREGETGANGRQRGQ
jgi:hypothetical protein